MSGFSHWALTAIFVGLTTPLFADNGIAQETGGDSAPSFSDQNEPSIVRDLVFRNVLNRAFPSIASKWTRNPVPVCWENASDNNADDRALIKLAAEESWAANSALKFSGWAACVPDNKGIRIRISDEGPHTKGLGITIDGVPNGMVLNTTFSSWKAADCPTTETEEKRKHCVYTIAVHEFGHAIGFAHEQNRADTPGECTIAPQGTSGDTLLTPWDPDSVMNYCNGNNHGKLSAFDIYAVQYLYGKP